MTSPLTNHIEHLYRAASTPRGIVVETDDVTRLRAKLYALMREYPQFSNLSLIPSPVNPSELWIVNKESPDGPT